MLYTGPGKNSISMFVLYTSRLTTIGNLLGTDLCNHFALEGIVHRQNGTLPDKY